MAVAMIRVNAKSCLLLLGAVSSLFVPAHLFNLLTRLCVMAVERVKVVLEPFLDLLFRRRLQERDVREHVDSVGA